MPRKDPYTGIMVMTMREFAQKMAEAEGLESGADWMTQLYADIEKTNAEETEHLKQPARALDFLREGVKGWMDADAPAPLPVEVVKVLHANVHGGLGPYGGGVRAVCRMDDGTVREVTAWYTHYPGTYIDPPDETGGMTMYRLRFGIPMSAWFYGQRLHVVVGPWEWQMWWSQTYDPRDRLNTHRFFGSRLWPWWKRLVNGCLFGITRTRR